MKDITLPIEVKSTGSQIVEISIREDGKVIWVNTENGCVLRICKIEKLIIVDGRKK